MGGLRRRRWRPPAWYVRRRSASSLEAASGSCRSEGMMDLEKALRMSYWAVGVVGWGAIIAACLAARRMFQG